MPASWLTKRRKMALTPEEKSHNKMIKELLGLQKGFKRADKRLKKKKKKRYWEKEDYSNALQYPRQQWPPY